MMMTEAVDTIQFTRDTLKKYGGTITIVNPEGKHVTLKIGTWERAGKIVRTIGQLSGPDNEVDYINFGEITDTGIVRVWSKHRQTIRERYATLLNHAGHFMYSEGYQFRMAVACRRCGRKLTTPESIESGIGPICQGK